MDALPNQVTNNAALMGIRLMVTLFQMTPRATFKRAIFRRIPCVHPVEHLRQLFITKSPVLRSEVLNNWRSNMV